VIETTPAVDSTAMLESMMLIRAYEEHNVAVQQSGGPGTCTSVGQEAAAVGVVRALGPNDLILTNHRSAGHLLARGADPGRMLAEVSGKATGYCKGKSGNLHISVKELGIILTSTIVGGELSLAPGVGMSLQMQGEGGIVACFFGDGAACEGVFHEALNIAAVWNLPILFVCENNQWQAFVSRKQTMLTDHISDRAAAYGIEGKTVDGNDVEAVYAAAAEAVAKVRETSKPYLLETYTYRTRGHYEPDDQAYVDKDELASWKAKDPIQGLSNRLQNRGALTPAQLDEIQERVKEIIARAADFAQESPYPEPSEVLTDVYA
jgi:acetoin:2,6-dichlorophenolindophenol oxidoreductase subunit alpha